MSFSPLRKMGDIDTSSQVTRSFQLFKKLDQAAVVVEASRTSTTPNIAKTRQERNETARKTHTAVTTNELPKAVSSKRPTPTLRKDHQEPSKSSSDRSSIAPLRERPSLEKGGLAGARSTKEDAALIRQQRFSSLMSTTSPEANETSSHRVSAGKSSALSKQVSELSLTSLLGFVEAKSSKEKASTGAKLRYSPEMKEVIMSARDKIPKKEAELDKILMEINKGENWLRKVVDANVEASAKRRVGQYVDYTQENRLDRSIKALHEKKQALIEELDQLHNQDRLETLHTPLFNELMGRIDNRQQGFEDKKLTINEEKYLQTFKNNSGNLRLNPSVDVAQAESFKFARNNSLITFLASVANSAVKPTKEQFQAEIAKYNEAVDALPISLQSKNTLKNVGNQAFGAINQLETLHGNLQKQLLTTVPQQTMKVADFATHEFTAGELNSLLAAELKIAIQGVLQKSSEAAGKTAQSDEHVIEHSVNTQKKLEDVTKGLGSIGRVIGFDETRIKQELQDLSKASLELVDAVNTRGKKDWLANLFLLNAAALQEYAELMVNVHEKGDGAIFQELKGFSEKISQFKSEIALERDPEAQTSSYVSLKTENELKIEQSVIEALDKMQTAANDALSKRIK